MLSAIAASWIAAAAVWSQAGIIETVAGTGRPELNLFEGEASEVNIDQPFGVEIGPGGALYICEVGHHRVLRLDLEKRRVATVAGNGKKGYSGDGGPAAEATLNEPYEVRFDMAGNMYFVEMVGAVIRRVDARTQTISTVAGTGAAGFSGDGGPAVKAQLSSPHSIYLVRDRLYVADIGNHRIRCVQLKSGIIETVAGNGEKKLPEDRTRAAGRPMLGPRALCRSGNSLWIALREGHSIWRMDLENQELARVAGSGQPGYLDGEGPQARFDGPKGIAAAPDGALLVMDTENQAIRKIDSRSYRVTTIAGSGPRGRGFAGDGADPLKAQFDRPHGIAVDSKGVLYIGDTNNHRVRRLRP